MDYDIECDWRLLNTCNYRCDYCFFTSDFLGQKLKVIASPQEWQAAFDGTGLTWMAHITGGEPSVYPGFVDLVSRLTQKHYISLNTNLTGPSLVEFARQIDPARVSFINAGFHAEERKSRNGDAAFLRNAAALRERGFPIFASVVATPTALERFAEGVKRLAPAGLYPVPKLLRGPHEGQVYPNAYTQKDKARFRRFAHTAREFYAPVLAAMASPPTVFVFDDDDYLGGMPSFVGQSCSAGRDFVAMEPNGDVFSCSQRTRAGRPKPRLGNLLAGEFQRRPGPAPCDSSYCFYFCRKYSKALPAGHVPAPPPPHVLGAQTHALMKPAHPTASGRAPHIPTRGHP